jgi:hypothetical protein
VRAPRKLGKRAIGGPLRAGKGFEKARAPNRVFSGRRSAIVHGGAKNMRKLHTPSPTSKPAKTSAEISWLANVVIEPKIDTVEAWQGRPYDQDKLTKNLSNIRKVLKRPIDKVDESRYGVRIGVNRMHETPEALELLTQYTHRRHDVAFDFVYRNEEDADSGQQGLNQHLVMKHASPRAKKVYYDNVYSDKDGREKSCGYESVYWSDWSAKHRYARQLFVYRKSPTVVRVELRFTNAAAVRRAGIDHVMKLKELNPWDVWNRNLKLVGLQDGFVERMGREAQRRYGGRAGAQIRHSLKNADMQMLIKGMKRVDRVIKTFSVQVPDLLRWGSGGLLVQSQQNQGSGRGVV